jgi:hypothetical protein
VSADGSSWAEALRIEAATGRVTAPVSGWREMLTGPRTYYVDPLLGSDTRDGQAAGQGAFATLDRAVTEVAHVDGSGHLVTVQLADGVYDLGAVPVGIMAPLGGGGIEIIGNVTNPNAVTVTSSGAAMELVTGRLKLRGVRLEMSGTEPTLRVLSGGVLEVDQVTFGTAGGHIDLVGGRLEGGGSYAIDGGAAYHLRLSQGAVLGGGVQALTLSNTPNFTTAFAICTMAGQADFSGHSFAGAATGKRFDVATQGVIQSGGIVLPGDTAGSVQSGGIYV